MKIIDTSGQPIAAAKINIEFVRYEWHDLRTADSEGLAYIPDRYLGKQAKLYKNNYFSDRITVKPGTFVLERAPQTFIELGEIEGNPIKMDNKHIITVTHLDELYHYSYDEDRVVELAHFEIPEWGRRSCHYLNGDTLWCAVPRDGIYIFDLSDPFSLVQIGYLPYEGWVFNIARFGSILVFETLRKDDGNFIHFYDYNMEGDFKELNVLETKYADLFHSISGYIIKRNEEGWINVIDYRDPKNIDTVFNELIFERSWGFFQGDTLIIKENVRTGNDFRGIIHHLMDFSNPANPKYCGDIKNMGRIKHIIDKSTVVCDYESNSYDFVIKRAQNPGEFETIAIISEAQGRGYYNFPYFICGQKVWRLVEAVE